MEKQREIQRAVKNIIHNELGITNDKVEKLICEYIDKILNKKLEDFINSNKVNYLINERIDKLVKPIIREEISSKLRFISVDVNIVNETIKTKKG